MFVAISLNWCSQCAGSGLRRLCRDAGSVALKQDGLIIAQQEFRDSEYGAQTAYSLRNLEDEKVNWLLHRFLVGALSPIRTRHSNGDNSFARISVGR